MELPITTEVLIVSRGEYAPEDIISKLEPVRVEKLYDDGHFMIHKLFLTHFTERDDYALLRAMVLDGEISDYTSIGVS